MDKHYILICTITLVLNRGSAVGDPVGPIQGFVQTNFVGKPVIHAIQSWVFDPDVSLRRRRQFEALHGAKGEYLIERLGLGSDGYEGERLQQQRDRDEGHLGGLNYFRP